jgi:hypothetical protein
MVIIDIIRLNCRYGYNSFKFVFFCSYGCTARVRTTRVVQRGGGPAPPLVRVGCSRTSARHDTLPDDPHIDADTPTVDSEVRNSYLLFISVSLQ